MNAGASTQLGGEETTEHEFAAYVDRAAREMDSQLLVDLLPERVPVYRGRSANIVNRMRGYLLAAFETTGLPEEALPYVLEELESGRDAYLVAAAARALRGRESRSSDIVPYLLKATDNITYIDDAVSFESYRPSWPLSRHTTALQEIAATLAWLREASTAVPAASDCCDHHAESVRPVISEIHRPSEVLTGVDLEDQDGVRVTFQDFFYGKPSVVAFFYTRCDNPNKCSLTITKLARLQQRLAELGVDGQIQTAGISYDPEFDLPARLRAYGENRGVVFSPTDRLFRTTGALAPVQDFFELGVSFGGTLVNRHRIELFVLDHRSQIAAAFTRLQWDVEEVLAQALRLATTTAQ
jgi:protein SCO1